ncbi:MAG: hypothetical protein IKK21_11925 [Clostridia bacterium]|nr:hypothetical protein [Clostridia bacterium]
MKKTSAASRAWTLYRRYFPQLMLALVLQIVLRLIVLAPLLFLATPQTRLLAVLSPVLFVLILLPARQNAAEVMAQLHQGYGFDLTGFVSFRDYGRKLLRGLKTTGLMLLWSLPFIAATVFAALVYSGDLIDGFTLLRSVISLGNHNLVKTLLPVSDSPTIRGVATIIVMYLLTALPTLVGWAFHAGTRHAAVLGQKVRCRLRVMGAWLLGLATLLPFLFVAVNVSKGYLSQLLSALSSIGQGSLSLPAPDKELWVIVAAFVVLVLPLIPFKQLLPASCVHNAAAKEEVAA